MKINSHSLNPIVTLTLFMVSTVVLIAYIFNLKIKSLEQTLENKTVQPTPIVLPTIQVFPTINTTPTVLAPTKKPVPNNSAAIAKCYAKVKAFTATAKAAGYDQAQVDAVAAMSDCKNARELTPEEQTQIKLNELQHTVDSIKTKQDYGY